ncbi:YtzI protein [Brevibacillus dissolubilis]|nr:YtzI protein [Brevibacillus dissolubilis]
MSTSVIVITVIICGIIIGSSIWAINKGYSTKEKIDDIDEL